MSTNPADLVGTWVRLYSLVYGSEDQVLTEGFVVGYRDHPSLMIQDIRTGRQGSWPAHARIEQITPKQRWRIVRTSATCGGSWGWLRLTPTGMCGWPTAASAITPGPRPSEPSRSR